MRCHRGSVFCVYISVCVWTHSAGHRFLNDPCRYPEMIDLHAENLASALLLSDSEELQGQLDEKLRAFTRGDIPHAAKAISTLFGILARCSPSETPPKIDDPGRRAKSKCSWAEGGDHGIPAYQKSMNTALIRSMCHGTFLDMEYVVRKNRVGDDKFVSIYLSSTIFHSVRPKLDACRSQLPLFPA